MKDKKGFTLIEIIVVLVILAILAVALVPSMLSYIEHAKASLCDVNIKSITRYYNLVVYEDNYTQNNPISLQQFMMNETASYYSDIVSYTCPSKGDYIVKQDTLFCTYHKQGQSDEEGEAPSPSIPTVPNTDINLSGNGWPKEDMFDDFGNYNFYAGEVFEYQGNYYIITKDTSIYKSNAQNGPEAVLGWDFMEKFTGITWDISQATQDIYLKDVAAGDLYIDNNGSTYIFTPNQGGWGKLPPEKYPEHWFFIK